MTILVLLISFDFEGDSSRVITIHNIVDNCSQMQLMRREHQWHCNFENIRNCYVGQPLFKTLSVENPGYELNKVEFFQL